MCRRSCRFLVASSSLLFLVLLLSLGCSRKTPREPVTDEPDPDKELEKRQSLAVHSIRQLGGAALRGKDKDGVWTVDLSQGNFTAENLPLLDDLTPLAAINLSGRQVGNQALERFTRFPTLERINLLETWVGDNGLAHLKSLGRLRALAVGPHVTDAGAVHLAAMKELRELALPGTALSDKGLEQLKQLVKLETLDLSGTRVTDKGLAALAGMKALRNLSLASAAITDAGLKHLQALDQLELLDLARTGVSGDGLAELAGLKRLHSLNLTGTRITGVALEQVKHWPDLESLALRDTEVADEGLKSLAGLARLSLLDLMETPVTDRGLAALVPLKGLRALILRRTQVTDQGVKDFSGARPDVKVYR